MSNHVEHPTSGPDNGPDPELIGLPAPRRPFRRLTLLCLSLTALGSLALLGGLAGDAKYSLSDNNLRDLGSLEQLTLRSELANRWVRGEGELAAIGGIRYNRPLESDSFRLAPLSRNPKIWVQIRVPAGYEDPHFVAPSVFAGRLMPVESLGLRYGSLVEALTQAGWQKGHLPEGAWLLVDGESPKGSRWILGLVAMFAGYFAFSVWALMALLRPIAGFRPRATGSQPN